MQLPILHERDLMQANKRCVCERDTENFYNRKLPVM